MEASCESSEQKTPLEGKVIANYILGCKVVFWDDVVNEERIKMFHSAKEIC